MAVAKQRKNNSPETELRNTELRFFFSFFRCLDIIFRLQNTLIIYDRILILKNYGILEIPCI